MNQPRFLLACAALAAAACAGCGSYADRDAPSPAAALTVPSGRYQARTDLMALATPKKAQPRWYSPQFPPLRSVRLFPNTPDRDLATDLRAEGREVVLDPTVYEQDVWMPAQADRLTRLLDAHFGTPATPAVRVPTWDQMVAAGVVRFDQSTSLGANLKEIRGKLGKAKVKDWTADWTAATAAKAELKLDDATLARGSLVYRRWCMQCHGPSGAGDAAYAIEAGPMPRDYRQGVFKFTTAFAPPNAPKKSGLGASGKARREDLKRTVRNGLDGSMMPSFAALTEAEIEDVVSYVIHLSIRGETEFATLVKAIKPGGDDPIAEGGELDWLFLQHQLAVLINWGIAAKSPIPVPTEKSMTETERIQSAIRGFKLYNSAEFGCASCHANYGRAQQLKWDAWDTVVQPRNLTLGVYRGGRRGEDLYARIYGGIAPSGMTAFHDRIANATPGQPDKIWDIVHFLQALADSSDRRRMQELDREVKFDP
ncbi:c-type cytochrome [Gemmata sp. SH-PL17]|uniref:c-type cytochrome n=1 Tax=Gemmata sp. SH-PL17 TaxID=1630693 RepID=UPI0009EE2053|nr:cytochrome c [Gemmata sp. SH-PL17]